MSKKLNILFASSEVEPFAKTGGLADVSGSLPKEIRKLSGDIRIFLPHYSTIDSAKYNIEDLPNSGFEVQIGGNLIKGEIKLTSLDVNGKQLSVYLIHNDKYFDRGGLYVNPLNNFDYEDNFERFVFFSRGVLEATKIIGWQPNIVHTNDWQTGLIPLYLKTLYSNDHFFANTKTVFTIHNLAYQGIFDKNEFPKTGLPWDVFKIDGIEFYDRINLMKAGIVYSDAVTTVSKNYAKEIRSSVEFGYGLEGLLAERKGNLYGILNGVDYSVWSPLNDEFIPQKYSGRNISKKIVNKKALLEKYGLPFDENIPVIGMISRLADQKGLDLIEASSDELLRLDLQLVFLGAGDEKYQLFLERLKERNPEKIGIYIGFSNELAHLIEAGSDMYLMPSRYEPCGLNQMYSLKYGTVPIVRATGGLEDSIEQYNPENKSGTGFKFYDYDKNRLTETVRFALEVFGDKKSWLQIMKNGMKQDFSWKASAKKYMQLYKSLIPGS